MTYILAIRSYIHRAYLQGHASPYARFFFYKSIDKCKIQFIEDIIIISVGRGWMKTKCVYPLLEKKKWEF